MKDGISEFCMPFPREWLPFRKCDECGHHCLTTRHYEIDDAGLICHVDANICWSCMKKAMHRAKKDRIQKKECENCAEYFLNSGDCDPFHEEDYGMSIDDDDPEQDSLDSFDCEVDSDIGDDE